MREKKTKTALMGCKVFIKTGKKQGHHMHYTGRMTTNEKRCFCTFPHYMNTRAHYRYTCYTIMLDDTSHKKNIHLH